ncbi:MAG TPA: hypothetical protein VIF11_15755 [Methylomirabilota bacterium]
MLTRERLEALQILADGVDARIETISQDLVQLKHDQRSLRTAILALQHELEAEDLARTPRVAPYTIKKPPTPEDDPND